jgi:four helix bundle protein
MDKIKSYKELIIWQKSVELVKNIYLLTKNFPQEEAFITIPQMRRASLSIPSNIAEGYGRHSKGDYSHFLSIAYASSLELETQLIIAKELTLCSGESVEVSQKLLLEVSKMLYVMREKLSKRSTLYPKS